jgi:hypothetical protein
MNQSTNSEHYLSNVASRKPCEPQFCSLWLILCFSLLLFINDYSLISQAPLASSNTNKNLFAWYKVFVLKTKMTSSCKPTPASQKGFYF